MSLPADLKYTESHEWVRLETDGTATVGITDHAQQALGDIVFLELPPVGKTVAAGDAVAVIESVKAASDIYAPVSGEIMAVNSELSGAPEKINSDPYGAWLFKLRVSDQAALQILKDAGAYRQFIGT